MNFVADLLIKKSLSLSSLLRCFSFFSFLLVWLMLRKKRSRNSNKREVNNSQYCSNNQKSSLGLKPWEKILSLSLSYNYSCFKWECRKLNFFFFEMMLFEFRKKNNFVTPETAFIEVHFTSYKHLLHLSVVLYQCTKFF